jgi:hypothetical protein
MKKSNLNGHPVEVIHNRRDGSKKAQHLFHACLFFLFLFSKTSLIAQAEFDVVIIGGGASGTTAGIQAARLGAQTLIVEESSWLGGMLTAAGVSAVDGNHNLPSGLWAEFRQKLRDYYGGAKELETGWVSNTLFEPKIGAAVLLDMAQKEKNLTVWFNAKLLKIEKNGRNTAQGTSSEGERRQNWLLKIKKERTKTIKAKIVVDGTELGDVAKAVGCRYRIGMDDPADFGEQGYAVKRTDIIQDLTYAATLKTYGKGNAPLVKKPKNYDPSLFYCSCATKCNKAEKVHDCEKMLTYGKLPNGKYMINWPPNGNDYYVNVIDASEKERQKAFAAAKNHTLAFVYYIQQELSYKNLGLADDEYPTKDRLPFMPYHRESRRIEGEATLTVNHILNPYNQSQALYRTGIAVGDYPIDHHHAKNLGAPDLNFPKIPSFNLPLGSLIPKNVDGLIVAEKSISVTNIVNGSTRLQPCVLLIGQAAGVLAALAAKENEPPRAIPVRRVQTVLLDHKAYLMPYFDIKPEHPHFKAIQRIGATGLLRGRGEPYAWANRTWFDPDSTIRTGDFLQAFPAYGFNINPQNAAEAQKLVTIREAIALAFALMENKPDIEFEGFVEGVGRNWEDKMGLKNFEANRPATRLEIAVLLDRLASPFERTVDLTGKLKE